MLKLNGLMQMAWRTVAALLLLVVTAHAATPVTQPLQRTSGSAFSAATADVTLSCSTSVVVTKTALPGNSPAPPHALTVETFPACAVSEARPRGIALGATGPPAAQTSFSPLNPRAPPAA
ncbi:MAG: hypothetical protein ABWZ75_03960 [Novosphingobium sp.]